ncbi:DUF3619 family protein [Ramlibacter sp. H39-3-26]|uniref:DUF3619 family protein n=1 Tax=Curvibacter soli TaxID=3031331 RepID=UPI0023DC09E5|nr:DUF3619 family protein [Ramlibacter sp. H39-3-26]MDF1485223.1 DUF3619 family protein [Ramlibacter sp. H39-3-26]
MTTAFPDQDALLDLFGQRVAARLTAGNDTLPYDIAERLRAARMQALAHRKVERAPLLAASIAANGAGAATLPWGEGGRWWRLLAASALPIVTLVAGLVAISYVQDESRAREIAEVDAALLTDDLPPAAYADPGFLQFLKLTQRAER